MSVVSAVTRSHVEVHDPCCKGASSPVVLMSVDSQLRMRDRSFCDNPVSPPQNQSRQEAVEENGILRCGSSQLRVPSWGKGVGKDSVLFKGLAGHWESDHAPVSV